MVCNIFPCMFRIDVYSLEVPVTFFASNKHNMYKLHFGLTAAVYKICNTQLITNIILFRVSYILRSYKLWVYSAAIKTSVSGLGSQMNLLQLIRGKVTFYA